MGNKEQGRQRQLVEMLRRNGLAVACTFFQKKESHKGGGQSTEEYGGKMYRKLDEDGGKKMIFKMARDITEDGRDVKRGAVFKKDNNGRLITDSKEALRIWAVYIKELLNGK